MKVKLDLTDNADIQVNQDPDGTVTSVVVTPKLLRKDGVGVVAKVSATTNKGKPLDSCLITVSGSTGKVSRTNDAGTNKAAVDEDEDEDDDTEEANGK